MKIISRSSSSRAGDSENVSINLLSFFFGVVDIEHLRTRKKPHKTAETCTFDKASVGIITENTPSFVSKRHTFLNKSSNGNATEWRATVRLASGEVNECVK